MRGSGIGFAQFVMRGLRGLSSRSSTLLQLRKLVPKNHPPLVRWTSTRKFSSHSPQPFIRIKQYLPPKNMGTVVASIVVTGGAVLAYRGYFSGGDPKIKELQKIAALFDTTLPKREVEDQQSETTYLTKCGQICFDLLFNALLEKKYSKLLELRSLLENFADSSGRTLLLAAAEHGDSSAVKWLLDEKIALNARDFKGNTPLHIACVHNQDHLLPLLCPSYANERNCFGENALHTAIRKGRAGLIKPLIDGAVDAKTPCQVVVDGEEYALSPIALSVASGCSECLDAIVEEADFPNTALATFTTRIGNLLHVAFFFGRPHIVRHLCEQHFGVVQNLINQQTGQNQCDPLSLAASLGYTSELRYLVDKGAKRDQVDSEGRTAVIRAAEKGHIDTIEMLIYLGFNSFTLDKNYKGAGSYLEAEPTKLMRLEVAQTKFVQGVKSPPNFLQEPPENLVFSGCDMGIDIYVGALKALAETGLLRDLKRVAGTSGGAITATLVALGYSVDRIEEIQLAFHPLNFLDAHDEELLQACLSSMERKSKWPIIKHLWFKYFSNFIYFKSPWDAYQKHVEVGGKGLCKGEQFRIWIESMVYEQTRIHNCTFGELRQEIEKGKNFKHLHVFAVNLDTKDIDCFNSEEGTDTVVIADAIRASMSIPLFFRSHQIHYKDHLDGERYTKNNGDRYIDGSILYGFPLDAFDRKIYTQGSVSRNEWDITVPNRKTLGLCRVSTGNTIEPDEPINGVQSIRDTIRYIIMRASANYQTKKSENHYRIISIPGDVGARSWLSFNLGTELGTEQKQKLVQAGYDTVKASPFFNQEEEDEA